MRSLRRLPLPDRRAARLAARSAPHVRGQALDGVGAIDALGSVLATYEASRLVGHGANRESDRAVRAAARRLAAEARTRDPVRAERLVIELRRAWRELPELGRVPDGAVRRALWDRLVRLCCEEFYTPGSAFAEPRARLGA